MTNSDSDIQAVLTILTGIGHNWLLALTVVTVLWLMVTKIAETHEAVRKLLGPLGRRMLRAYERRQARYREDVAQEAKSLAVELLPKVIPADYESVKGQLRNIIDRVTDLELENSALRAFVIYDEEWHFKDTLNDVREGLGATRLMRLTWTEFLTRWKAGWRPSTLDLFEGQVRDRGMQTVLEDLHQPDNGMPEQQAGD